MQFKIIQKKSIAILFNFIMLSCITVPTVLKAIDSSIDVSIVYNLTEEEEKETQLIKSDELFFSKALDPNYSSITEAGSFFGPYIKNYKILHLSQISPPPEKGILIL